jgi:hypothetical protein
MLLLLVAAIVVLAVLGSLGPDPERPSRSIEPSPSERRTDVADVECRLYVSFGTSGSGPSPSILSVTVSGPAGMMENRPAVRIYRRVTVTGATGSVARTRVSDPTGCASAVPTVRVARNRS